MNLLPCDKYILTMKVCNRIILHLASLNINLFIEKYEELKKLEHAWLNNFKYQLTFNANDFFPYPTLHNEISPENLVRNVSSINENSFINPTFSKNEEDQFSDQLVAKNRKPILIQQVIKSFKNKFFPCKTCNKILTSKKFLERHLQLCGQKRICWICKEMVLQKNFKLHKSRHLKTNSHKCNICGKCFLEKKGLNQHLLSHGIIKKFHLCTSCGRIFKDHTQLHKHNLEVHVGRRFPCSVCNKKFTRNYDLNIHMLRHSRLRQFKCGTCSKDFSTKKCLSRHLKSHAAAQCCH